MFYISRQIVVAMLISLVMLDLAGCKNKNVEYPCSSHYRYLNGKSPVLTAKNFFRIKEFVLLHGDRQTYCSMYSNNPHYEFEKFRVYLNPDGCQFNSNCDPNLSDFSEMAIFPRESGGLNCYVGLVSDPQDAIAVRWPDVKIPTQISRALVERYFNNIFVEIAQKEEKSISGSIGQAVDTRN